MPDVTISYKGSQIASMDNSGTKTLLTEGMYCEDDITIQYAKYSPEVYDGEHHQSPTPTPSVHTITIVLINPLNFGSCHIYTYENGLMGQELGRIIDITNGCSVTVQTDHDGIYVLFRGTGNNITYNRCDIIGENISLISVDTPFRSGFSFDVDGSDSGIIFLNGVDISI